MPDLRQVESQIEHFQILLDKSEDDYQDMLRNSHEYEESFLLIAKDHYIKLNNFLRQKIIGLQDRLEAIRNAPNPEFVDLLCFHILFRMDSPEVFEDTISALTQQKAIDLLEYRYGSVEVVDIKVI